MNIVPLEIPGTWVASPEVHLDSRGSFTEWFHLAEVSKATGEEFVVAQANHSISKRGVLRGLHFSLSKKTQSKWIYCLSGSVQDVLVDLREKSPTFLQHISIVLDSRKPKYVLVPHGVGHGFLSLEDNTNVVYLMSSTYEPTSEYTINPFDNLLNINWKDECYQQSERDMKAMGITFFKVRNLLPTYAENRE